MALSFENPTDYEVQCVICFLQTDEILGYHAEEALSHGIILLHDNAHPHTARQTQALLCEQFHGDIFEHPPYSSDLAPRTFSCFQK